MVAERKGCESPRPRNKELVSNLYLTKKDCTLNRPGGNEVSGCQESLGEQGESETYATAGKSHIKKGCGATKPVIAHAGKHGGEVFSVSKEEG